MRILSNELLDAARPEPSAVRHWLDHPVTERLFNVVFRLDTLITDSAVRDGFKRCQSQILDIIVGFEEVCRPAPVAENLESDYQSSDILQRRRADIGTAGSSK